MRNLERISNEIHAQRKRNKSRRELGERTAGVGEEQITYTEFVIDSMLTVTLHRSLRLGATSFLASSNESIDVAEARRIETPQSTRTVTPLLFASHGSVASWHIRQYQWPSIARRRRTNADERHGSVRSARTTITGSDGTTGRVPRRRATRQDDVTRTKIQRWLLIANHGR